MAERSLGRLLSLLHRYFHIYLSEELLPYNIGKGQALFLLSLYHLEGATQEELAGYLHIDKSTTARAIDRLQDAGYVKKVPKKNDLRSKQVFLTPLAKKIEPRIIEILERWTKVLSEDLTGEEFDQALKLLEKMTGNAINHIQDVKKVKALLEDEDHRKTLKQRGAEK